MTIQIRSLPLTALIAALIIALILGSKAKPAAKGAPASPRLDPAPGSRRSPFAPPTMPKRETAAETIERMNAEIREGIIEPGLGRMKDKVERMQGSRNGR